MPHKKVKTEFEIISRLMPLAGALILMIVPIIRLIKDMPLIMGVWPYYHDIISKDFLYYFGLGESNIYHFLLYLLSFVTDRYNVIMPFTLGIVSLYILYLLLKGFDSKLKTYIFLMAITSPFFLYSYTYSTPLSLLITLYLTYILLLRKDSSMSYIIALLISSFSIMDTIVAIIISYLIRSKKTTKVIMVGMIVQISYVILFNRLEPFLATGTLGQYPQAISDLGSVIGVGFFNVILAIIGLIFTWKKNRIDINWMILAMILLYIFFEKTIILYISMVIIFLSGYGFYYLENRKWLIQAVKSLTIFTLICGLIFSGLSYITRLSSEPPSKEIVDSLKWLSERDTNTIFSGKKEGFWIRDISGKETLCDYNICNDTLYYNITKSRLLDSSYDLLRKNNVSHIIITKDMRARLWNESDDGLLFILSNPEAFNPIYMNEEVEIYKINESYSPLSYLYHITDSKRP